MKLIQSVETQYFVIGHKIQMILNFIQNSENTLSKNHLKCYGENMYNHVF